jgi:transcriptional regulator with XRE-family HTH domain
MLDKRSPRLGVVLTTEDCYLIHVSEDDFYRSLGRRIGDLRRATGYTQDELADMVSITTSYLSRIEIGIRHPTLNILRALSVGLHVPMWRLVSDDRLTPPEHAREEAVGQLVDDVRNLSEDDFKLVRTLAERLHATRRARAAEATTAPAKASKKPPAGKKKKR